MKKQKPLAVYILIGLILFLGLSALGGGAALIAGPDGSLLHMPVSVLDESLFRSYLVPGLILFFVFGVFPVFTFCVLLWQPSWRWLQAINIYSNHYAGWMLSLFTGLALIIWMYAEIIAIGYGSIVQSIYFILGLLILILTMAPGTVRYYEGNPDWPRSSY